MESEEEVTRTRAADALVGFYMRKKQYEKAEEYLNYFSMQNPERKRKQAQIYGETNRQPEAWKAYEELLFVDYQMVSATLHGMYTLALQSHDMEKAHMLAAKQEEMARCLEMGKYYEASARLELATLEQEADAVIEGVGEMLSSVEQVDGFRSAPLYEHMEFKEMRKEFVAELKENLRKSFREEETYGFLGNDKRWKELVG